MSSPPPVVQKQIQRVHRRLFLQTLLDHLMWCWAGALGVAALWFLLQPVLIGKEPEWLRLAVAGSALAGSTVLAGVLAWFKAPSHVEAALALDHQFELKERVTTICTLSVQQAQGPAGQALFNDVEFRLAGLDVPSRFPVRLTLSTGLIPTCAAFLAILTFFFQPDFSSARNNNPKKDTDKVANAKDIQDQMDKLKKVQLPKRDLDPLKDDKLKELEAEWDKIVKKPLDPSDKEKIRERIQEMRNLEDKMKDRIQNLKDLADKNKDLKKQLEKLANIDPKGQKLEPPLKDLEEALAKNQTDKAIEILDKLAKDLKSNKLSPEEKKKLEKQLEDLANKLQRLADQKDLKDQLKKDFEDGKITKEELDREMNRLAEMAKEMGDLQDLKDLADLLKDCKNGLGEGHWICDKLGLVKAKLEATELTEQELRDLLEQQDALEAARLAMLEAMRGNGMGQGEFPGAKRPIGEDPTGAKVVPRREKAESDAKAQQRITGFTKGGTFSKVPAKDVGGSFRQAVQDAPEAIERQRIPNPEAADMVKGYFQKLGGQR